MVTQALEEQSATSSTLPALSAVGGRFSAAVATAVIIALAVSLIALDGVGKSSRVVPATASIVVVDDSVRLLEAWRVAGLHGVVLVDVTRDLGYTGVPVSAVPAPKGWPVPEADVLEIYRRAADRRNIVWIGARTGIVRSVAYLLTPADLAEKVRVGREGGFPGISGDGSSITANDEGYLRLIGSSLPPDPGMPAVLNIDASYFISGTPEGLAAQLRGSLANYRLVTVDRAMDATDVPQAARLQADRMADILRAQVSE